MNETGQASTGDTMHMIFGKRAFFGYLVNDGGSGGWFVNLPHRASITLVLSAPWGPAGYFPSVNRAKRW